LKPGFLVFLFLLLIASLAHVCGSPDLADIKGA
jgi:hypothetical protein